MDENVRENSFSENDLQVEAVEKMITVIANNDFYETIITKYNIIEFPEARNRFIWDWINGVIGWDNFEYFGKGCKVKNPAFTPEFLKQHGFDDEPPPIFIEGVCIYNWFCITGIHGSDEHYVTAYFIQTKDYLEIEKFQK